MHYAPLRRGSPLLVVWRMNYRTPEASPNTTFMQAAAQALLQARGVFHERTFGFALLARTMLHPQAAIR